MHCHQAENLMMKYLDGDIRNAELAKLRHHTAICPKCSQDLYYYEMIQRNICHGNTYAVTESFEQEVITKIREISPCYFSSPHTDKTLHNILSVFVAVTAVMAAFIFYSRPICAAISENVFFRNSNFDAVIYYATQIQTRIENGLMLLNHYFMDYQLILLFALIVIFFLQYIKNKSVRG